MNYLIGDIGNTNIKICKTDKKFKIIKTYLFETTIEQNTCVKGCSNCY